MVMAAAMADQCKGGARMAAEWASNDGECSGGERSILQTYNDSSTSACGFPTRQKCKI